MDAAGHPCIPSWSGTAGADVFGELNAQQREAVMHGSGALLVIAGAGSGKTLTLAARVARLVLDGADPQRLMLLTFSRRAAQEMQHRAGLLLHRALGLHERQRAPALPWSGTFHSVGARLLREQAARLGLSPDFTVLDRGDSEDLIGLVRQELGFAATRMRFPLKGTCLSIYSRVVNTREPLARVIGSAFPWCAGWEEELTRLFDAYAGEKQRQQVLDFDDLLLYWSLMMEEPSIAHALRDRFDHVLVDEYQDTNRMQAAILAALAPEGRGVTVVGDDAQSIYSFRAAQVRNILDFPKTCTPNARVIALEQNYRSTQPLLDASNAVIAQAGERHDKRLWSERASSMRAELVAVEDESDQARWIADAVLARREEGVTLKRQAVLFRTGHHSAALELELGRRNIPFVKFGGLRFLEAAHVKDVLSVLRWAQNPRCTLAGLRAAQLVPGFGPASARRLSDAMAAAEDAVAALHAFKPPAASLEDWSRFLALYDALRAHADWPGELQAVQRWYAPLLASLHDDAPTRLADIEQLARLAGGYPSRERFLTELTLDPPSATSDESQEPGLDEDYLILSTIHSAKGQEWHAVYVLNVVDGCIPSDMATGSAAEIDEERRLLYVAMTRARERLHLLVPQRFYVTQQSSLGDRHLYGALTRFIPPEVARHFAWVGPHSAAPEITSAASQAEKPGPLPAPGFDIAARARARWSS